MSDDAPRPIGVPQLLGGLLRVALFALVLATPIFAVWLASSLAVYHNGSSSLAVAAGALLFPVGPLAWEWIASSPRRRGSRFLDRLILRTLALSLLFLGVLLVRYPERAFVALSTRGDWWLQGRGGPGAERARGGVFSAARALEWLYRAVRNNPYKDKWKKSAQPTPESAPPPTPPPAPSPEAPKMWPQSGELHEAVRTMPPDAERSIEEVGRYLRTHTSGPRDRIRAIHDYVADRIAYDVAALSDARLLHEQASLAEPVFVRRRGVCAGYAQLMRAIATVTGDVVEYVVGDARTVSDPTVAGEPHAWNAALVDGAWYLIDATWDAGTVTDGKFEKGFRTDYLFTPPEVFGVRHHPDDSQWQLRAEPIDRGAFMRQPMMDASFFAHGFRLIAPDRSQVTVAGSFEVALARAMPRYVIAQAEPKPAGEPIQCAVTLADRTLVRCPLVPGVYDVILFDSPTETGRYLSMGRFDVNVTP